MKDFMNRMKFEYVFSILVGTFLAVAYFLTADAALKDKILMALIGWVGMIFTFLFTRTVPNMSTATTPSNTPVANAILPEIPATDANSVTTKYVEQAANPPQ